MLYNKIYLVVSWVVDEDKNKFGIFGLRFKDVIIESTSVDIHMDNMGQ